MVSTDISSAQRYKPTLRDVLSIFFFYKRTFVLTFVGVVVAALLLVLISPAVYKVSGRLVVKPRLDKPDIFQADTSYMSTSDRVEQSTLNTVVNLINSSDVIRAVVVQQHLAKSDSEEDILEAIDNLRGKLSVEPLSMSNIIEVTLKGGSPTQTQKLLNAILEAYIDYHIRINQSLEGRLEFFDLQARVFKSKYDQLGQELGEAYRRLNLVNPEIQGDNQLKVLNELEVRRSQALSNFQRLQKYQTYLIDTMKRSEIQEALASLPTELRDAYPALTEMEKSLAQLVINRERARSDFMPGTKPTQDAENQYRNMRSQIRSYLASALDALKLDKDAAQLEYEHLGDQISNGKQGLGELSADALMIEQINFEYKMAEDNYKLYEAKREEARINREKDRSHFANVSIASRPLLPINPWFPQKTLIMLVAIVAGFFLAVVATAATYLVDYTVRTPADILLRSRLRLLGTLDAV